MTNSWFHKDWLVLTELDATLKSICNNREDIRDRLRGPKPDSTPVVQMPKGDPADPNFDRDMALRFLEEIKGTECTKEGYEVGGDVEEMRQYNINLIETTGNFLSYLQHKTPAKVRA